VGAREEKPQRSGDAVQKVTFLDMVAAISVDFIMPTQLGNTDTNLEVHFDKVLLFWHDHRR
jgi:hypothetical protein